jgi:catechol 2,3-dioxygenase-like lactoylglutathione lyase family enzyme
MEYRLHHPAITVRDMDESVAFYALLGYEVVHREDDHYGSILVIMRQAGSYIEFFQWPQNDNAEPFDFPLANDVEQLGIRHLAWQVDDLEAAMQDLLQKGVPPERISRGRGLGNYFFVKDPDGWWIEVLLDRFAQANPL